MNSLNREIPLSNLVKVAHLCISLKSVHCIKPIKLINIHNLNIPLSQKLKPKAKVIPNWLTFIQQQ